MTTLIKKRMGALNQVATNHKLRLVQSILGKMEYGTIQAELHDGNRIEIEGCNSGFIGEIRVHNPKFFRRLLSDGNVGFGEMYMDGWWSTPNLENLLDIILLNNDILVNGFPGSGLFRIKQKFMHLLNANSRKGSSRNIAYHYDLGNEFYRLWLDDTLTYSSALFKHEEETLSQAQNNKYAAICDRLELHQDDQVLEIGCGWGGFAEFAAKERGIKVTGLTISKEQQEHAEKRVFEAGLAERVSIHLRDYRDEKGTYDGIASIEMIEAVGERYWPVYFKTLYDRLRPGGVAAIQAITISDNLYPNYRKGVDFMQKHIFPGGMLPSRDVMVKQGQSANLNPVYVHNFGGCYSKTLRLWRSRFNKRWNEISKLGFDKRFKRMWNYYLAASAASFRANSIDVIQVGYKKM